MPPRPQHPSLSGARLHYPTPFKVTLRITRSINSARNTNASITSLVEGFGARQKEHALFRSNIRLDEPRPQISG
jgi:hypothetical protein